MTELSFAKSFLSTLDSRPVKLQSDYVADPKTFEPKGPYTLPRMPHPMRRPTTTPTAPGSAPSFRISLKSLRNPPLDLTLSAQTPQTSILELKQAVAEHLGLKGTEKIRLLYAKKPCADSKSVKDVVGDGVSEGKEGPEFSVMVMGGLPGASGEGKEAEGENSDAQMEDAPVTAEGSSGVKVLKSEEFWENLKGFLLQRVRSQRVAEETLVMFREAWLEKGSSLK
ncbi:hypothetical protein MMC30_001408 [Trapelia coarctata]|nr:hypothetical protein [Trapelia coarctata]